MSEALGKTSQQPPHPLPRAYSLLSPAMEKIEARLEETIQSAVRLVPEVSHHLIGSGGKRIRPTLLMLIARTNGANADLGLDLAVATELFHNATLLHDDVVDRGHFRRGVPAAPRIFGNAASVLVGDFLLAKAFGIVVQHGDLDLLRELSRVVQNMAEGEVMQLIRSGQATLSMPGYEEIISGKTAGLFSWCCRAGASLNAKNGRLVESAADYGKTFGMAFQVTDDILDYTAPLEESGKDLANDLRQGKTTLPLLLACEQDRDLLNAVAVLSKQGPTEEKCQEIVRRVLETSAIERARDMAGELVGRAKESLAEFPDGPAVKSLRELTSYIVDRVTIR
jgi:octaprenyl-diphosphate synthase